MNTGFSELLDSDLEGEEDCSLLDDHFWREVGSSCKPSTSNQASTSQEHCSFPSASTAPSATVVEAYYESREFSGSTNDPSPPVGVDQQGQQSQDQNHVKDGNPSAAAVGNGGVEEVNREGGWGSDQQWQGVEESGGGDCQGYAGGGMVNDVGHDGCGDQIGQGCEFQGGGNGEEYGVAGGQCDQDHYLGYADQNAEVQGDYDERYGAEQEEDCHDQQYDLANYTVLFWFGVVNLPDEVTKHQVTELFGAEFLVYMYKEIRHAVKNAVGFMRSVQCIVAAKDWRVAEWTKTELKEAVLKFWFNSNRAAAFNTPSPMWLQEVEPEYSKKGRTTRVKVLGLDVGSFYDKGTFVKRAEFEESSSVQMYLYLDFSSRSAVIMIDNRFTIEFNTREVQDFVVVDFSFESSAIYLTLKNPPKIYSVTHWEPSEMSLDPDPDTKTRQNKIGNLPVDVFAYCQTYKLQMENTDSCPAVSNRSVQAVLDLLGTVGKKDIYYAKIGPKPLEYRLPSCEQGIPKATRHHSSWDVNLAWLCLSSTNGFVIDRYHEAFFKKLDESSEDMVKSALYAMAAIIARDAFVDPMIALDIAMQKGGRTGYIENLGDPNLHCMLPRVMVTPTRLLFFEPDIIQTNRVLRIFGQKHHFIRVSIRDDSFAKISSVYGKTREVMDYIEGLLNTGFKIGGKVFKFLGASNSQVRDHGCWFVEIEDERDTARMIRESIGQLSGIKNVAKYLSRLGQGFSTSTQTVMIEVPNYHLIPDVERNGYCFTDGIGKITPDLAEEVATHLGLPYTPCGFQIRFSGAKGVVTVNRDPNLNRDHPGKHIFIRKSMLKYNSQHTIVEVLQSKSEPQQLYLNQQLIMLMSNLGVPDRVFMNLMKQVLNNMSNMFIEESMAQEKMHGISCGVMWSDLEAARFDITSEPYLRSMLMSLYRVQMLHIRTKSRIPLDPSGGRVLLGVADDTGTLEYGQVFIQISTDPLNALSEKKVLEQTVLVGKSPCLHPGDVRTFQAVNCPGLRHMADCIVFPVNGPRPHPNEMSGSDLDGDMYHTIWDPEMLPKRRVPEPMMYTSSKDKEISGEITVPMMIGFLRQSIEFDCIGQIDNTHKALADSRGLESHECIHLAELHSKAVDAPKTGKWVSVPGSIRRTLTKYPDFMMKADRPSYPSSKVLGQMFRECKKYMSACSLDLAAVGCAETHCDHRFRMPGYEDFVDDARIHRQQYNSKLEGLLRIYGIFSEGELMTGYIEKYHEKLGRERSDVVDMAASVRQKLVSTFREEFFRDELLYNEGSLDDLRAMKKAAAWYYVTYNRSEDAETYQVGDVSARFLSFPWVVSDILMKIYKMNMEQGNVQVHSVKTAVELSIHKMFDKTRPCLVEAFAWHCELQSAVNKLLSGWEGCYAFLCNLSVCCLFHDDKVVDLLIYNSTHGLGFQMTLNSQKAMLRAIKESIQRSCKYCCILRTPGLARLKFNLRWMRNMQGNITVDPNCLVQSLLLVDYIYWNVWLLPLLRVVTGWGEATGLIGSKETCLLDPLLLCYMVIGYCLNEELIVPLDGRELQSRVECGDVDHGYFSPELWYRIIGHLDYEYAAPHLGTLLLGLFRNAEYVVGNVHPALQPVLGCSTFSGVPNVNHEWIGLVKDELMRAFHRLCMHHNVEALMEAVPREDFDFIKKSDCHSMIGSEQYYARYTQYMTREEESDIEVHTQVWSRTPGMVFKITGTNTAILAVKRQIQYFRDRGQLLAFMDKHYPGVSCVRAKGASLLLFEGYTSQLTADKVVFEDHFGPRYHEHDNTGIYIAKVILDHPCSWHPIDILGNEFAEFRDHLQKRFGHIGSAYKPVPNGPLQFHVQFGFLYMVNIPKGYLEAPGGVSPEEVRKAVADARMKGTVDNPIVWLETLRSKQGQPSIQSGVQSGFYPRINPNLSRDNLRDMLKEEGFEEELLDEGYYLTIRGIQMTLVAKYDKNLTLVQIYYPPLKWMVTDLKRKHPDKKEVTCDIRFEITSQRYTSLSAEAWELKNALLKRNGFVSVKKEVMKRADELRDFKRWEFTKAKGTPSQLKLYVDKVLTSSRPKKNSDGSIRNFSFHEHSIQLHIVHDLMGFYRKQIDKQSIRLPDNFIVEVWKQSLGFSDRLLGLD